ncbi:hypothetical protein OSTOST_17735 [Ostertagia ostertagi]
MPSFARGRLIDAQAEDGEDLQAKLQELNRLIDNDQGVLGNHQRVPFTHSGISEDSDYTSDVFVSHSSTE